MDNIQVQIMGKLAEAAYNDALQQNDSIPNTQYTVVARQNKASGMQSYLLQESGTGKYVFAFRGTELATQFWNDFILADGSMVLGMAPQQMKDALGFVHDMMTVRDADHGGLKYGSQEKGSSLALTYFFFDLKSRGQISRYESV